MSFQRESHSSPPTLESSSPDFHLLLHPASCSSAACPLRVRQTVYVGSTSRALIEPNWAWLELGVRVFCFKVSVLSVSAAEKGQ